MSQEEETNFSTSTKKPWVKAEDDILIALVAQYGSHDWFNIAFEMKARGVNKTGKQCRERWLNQLSPNVRKDPWTDEEDQIIIEAHKKLGNKWVAISKLLNGRPPNAVKNRWNGTLHRKVQQMEQRQQLAAAAAAAAASNNSASTPAVSVDGQTPVNVNNVGDLPQLAMMSTGLSGDPNSYATQVSSDSSAVSPVRSNPPRRARKRKSVGEDISDEDSDEFTPNGSAKHKTKKRKSTVQATTATAAAPATTTPSNVPISVKVDGSSISAIYPQAGQGLQQFATAGSIATSSAATFAPYVVDPAAFYFPSYSSLYALPYPYTTYNIPASGNAAATFQNVNPAITTQPATITAPTSATVDELSAMYLAAASQQVQHHHLQAQLQQVQQTQQVQGQAAQQAPHAHLVQTDPRLQAGARMVLLPQNGIPGSAEVLATHLSVDQQPVSVPSANPSSPTALSNTEIASNSISTPVDPAPPSAAE